MTHITPPYPTDIQIVIGSSSTPSQYQLIRGILDHNLGEQFTLFAVPDDGYLKDPVQVVGPEDKVYKSIAIAIDLTNVTGEVIGKKYVVCH